VSKIPPTPAEVRGFVELVDRLRGEVADSHSSSQASEKTAIGVHCHYGYNRTGFFICAYLIEREGYDVERALEEFAKAKKPGIKHAHFVDALWARYTSGLRKAPTWKPGVEGLGEDDE
jgi:protein-tyrosine phosphatase